MGTVTQGHEWQQGPVVLGSGIAAFFDAEPSLHLGTARMVEIDYGNERDEGVLGHRARLCRRRRRDGHG